MWRTGLPRVGILVSLGLSATAVKSITHGASRQGLGLVRGTVKARH